MKKFSRIATLAALGVLAATPAYAMSEPTHVWVEAAAMLWLLFIWPVLKALEEGSLVVAFWISMIPVSSTLMALAAWFNLNGTNPRIHNEFTYQEHYKMSAEDRAKADHVLYVCNVEDKEPGDKCGYEYMECVDHNLCTGHFKFIITDRLRQKQEREMVTVPNATVTTSPTSSKACPIDPDHVNPNSFTEVYERLNNPNCRPKK